jgi:hypothetical protein
MTLATIIIIAFLHTARGAGAFKDLPGTNLTWTMLGIATALFLGDFDRPGLMAALYGMTVAIGHGKYFMAFHGLNRRDESECPFTDAILRKIESVRPLTNRHYGALGMSLRYLIWSSPFIILNPMGWSFMGMAGAIYYTLPGKEGCVRRAELALGLVIGYMLVGAS